MTVLAYAETRGGAVGKPAREATGAARAMAEAWGAETHVVALGGPGTADAARGLASLGADRIHVAEGEGLALYQPDVVAAAVSRLIGEGGFRAVVFPATAQGKDLAPRVAARLGCGLATEIVSWSADGEALVVRRPMYAGKAIATLRLAAAPALVTIRANVFAAEERPGAGELVMLAAADEDARIRVTELEIGDRAQLDVAEATIVVSGGRGMQDPEHWHLLEDLVKALGEDAALGASRAVVDAGWRPHGEQVGQTGKTVSPNLYFAVGISGAIQHLAGMRTAKVIVAINRDAEAPIFGVADYGIVGDVFEILPPLTQAIRTARAGG